MHNTAVRVRGSISNKRYYARRTLDPCELVSRNALCASLWPHCCRQNMRSPSRAFTPQSNLVLLLIKITQQNPGVCVCGEMMAGCGVMTVLFLNRPFVVLCISERVRAEMHAAHKYTHVCIYVSCM